ncbi:MAG: UvrD-helicase domain-containing protein [Gemmatimonadales bacterium]
MTPPERLEPTPAQQAAISAPPGPALVLAGPGAGKTFCLIERIRFLIETREVDPARICALTFTNKAAEEVAARLRREIGERAEPVTRSTIHSLCVRILRAHGEEVGLERGFGIADEDYQHDVLGRFGVGVKWRAGTLTRFGAFRLGRAELGDRDRVVFGAYRRYLERRKMVDFDDLIHLTNELFTSRPEVAREVARGFDQVLVDEFQDLNHIQYAIVKALAAEHRNLFVVGDDEQSIFSWTGADPALITTYLNEFSIRQHIVLDQNRRTAREIFALARKLVSGNPSLFDKSLTAVRSTAHPVEARRFADEKAETAWLLADIGRDREAAALPWGEFAILYRTHAIGDVLEGALMQAGIPCRLAAGRSMTDDPAVSYLMAALKVIAYAGDPVVNQAFCREVLPGQLFDRIRQRAAHEEIGFMPLLRKLGRELPMADQEARKIRRALATMNNLSALGQRHEHLGPLADEILSQRVGRYQTALENRAEDLSDPADLPEAVALAEAILQAAAARSRILVRPMGGAEIGLAGLISAAGFRLVDYLQPGTDPEPGALVIDSAWSSRLGLGVTVFKALQVAVATTESRAGDFVVVDLETTDRDVTTAEVVEIAAVRVRNWEIVAEFHRLVKPRTPIAPAATKVHGYSMADLEDAPFFEEVWPAFETFADGEELVAHNGFSFDFQILARMTGKKALRTYDTLPLARSLRLGSARLEHLAARFGIDPGRAHHALSDVRTLAAVFRKLEEERIARSRRVALANALDFLGVALALVDPETLDDEGRLLKDMASIYALGRFSTCLDFYQRERDRVGVSAASLDDLIERLGGVGLMLRVRTEKGADQRYPTAMARVRRLLEGLEATTLAEEIQEFLGRIALSKSDGVDTDSARVNLLTLHATKGLEFSRVYIVGVEDTSMPGGKQSQSPAEEELQESRRLLYVGMTRAKDRLVMTRVDARNEAPTGGQRFFDEMGLTPEGP